jgi:preprotein translocase subunit SecA
MLKKYDKIINKINSFDYGGLHDSHLFDEINTSRSELLEDKPSEEIIAKVFAVIREVIDRRLGIWKLFDRDLYMEPLQETYALVSDKRASLDDSHIHLDAPFYSSVRDIRKPEDGLTFWVYDVQLIGALALYDGKIGEMGTGEGKTVVAVFPASIWALSGKKVHIATVNDYLALRDCNWMAPVYRFLGLEVDCVLSYMPDAERRQSYKADVVYGNNYEFGFDYLRDNVKDSIEDRVQGKLEYVIIDEIDSILMDEATTPLVISSAPMDKTTGYWKLKPVVENLITEQDKLVERLLSEIEGETDSRIKSIKLIQITKADPWNQILHDYLSKDKNLFKRMRKVWSEFATARSEHKLEEGLFYVVDEKNRTVKLTERGINLVELKLGQKFMTVYGEELRNFLQILRAYILYRKDEDYIVQNGRIIIVDEFTGRLAFGKKYEEGLHQAIECKEGLEITPENQVVGSITHPNYFRLYKKMTGMTATAHTEAEEFRKLYKLDVARIPPNKPVIRTDLPDRFFRTEEEKLHTIVDEVEKYHELGHPILVGTRSVEKSERLSGLLSQSGIQHNVLNAKNHAQEADIIKRAGRIGAVTIATNMAGRGTDIRLEDARRGLHVIGSERHGARRIDHQLIGRSGRQGDPGSSQFFISLQDDIFRIFGREEMSALVKAFDQSRNDDLERLIRKAQKSSEEASYQIRRYLNERDNVFDKQRKTIYNMREEALTEEWTSERIMSLIDDYVSDLMERQIKPNSPLDEQKFNEFIKHFADNFDVHVKDVNIDMPLDDLKRLILEAFEKTYRAREAIFGSEFSCKLAKAAMMESLEVAWIEYLSSQSEFDKALSLRSYVKGNTLTDYRLESSRMFQDLVLSIKREALKDIFTYPLPKKAVLTMLKNAISGQVEDLLSEL